MKATVRFLGIVAVLSTGLMAGTGALAAESSLSPDQALDIVFDSQYPKVALSTNRLAPGNASSSRTDTSADRIVEKRMEERRAQAFREWVAMWAKLTATREANAKTEEWQKDHPWFEEGRWAMNADLEALLTWALETNSEKREALKKSQHDDAPYAQQLDIWIEAQKKRLAEVKAAKVRIEEQWNRDHSTGTNAPAGTNQNNAPPKP